MADLALPVAAVCICCWARHQLYSNDRASAAEGLAGAVRIEESSRSSTPCWQSRPLCSPIDGRNPFPTCHRLGATHSTADLGPPPLAAQLEAWWRW